MRRRTLFVSTIVLLALFLSGWSGVLAAALCPHAVDVESSMMEDHSCCRAKLERAQDCSSVPDQTEVQSHSSHHEAMNEMQMTGAAERSDTEHKGIASKEPAESCTHCIGRSELPTKPVTARQSHQTKRGISDASLPASTTLASLAPTFTLTSPVRQHGPPGVAARKHLLLSVFLI